MKVAYLVNRYPAKSHTFIRREIAALISRGVEISRFTIRRSEPDLIEEEDLEERALTHCILSSGVTSILFAALRTLGRNPARTLRALALARRATKKSRRGPVVPLAYLAEACVLLQRTKREGIHHVHAHFGTNPATVAMLWKALGGGTFSFTVHGSSELSRPEENAIELKVEHADLVIAISKHCRSQLYRWATLHSWHKIKVIHCGLNHRFLAKQLTPLPKERRFFWAGRFSMLKGLPILIEAARILKQEGERFEIVLAGDGPMREELVGMIRENHLEEHIQLTGWLADEDVKDELEQARFLVLPSFSEGLPVAIMEALARGRPVIASRITAIPELVQDGVSGWTVAPGDPEELAAAMKKAIQMSDEKLEKMGFAGRVAVLEQHDVETSAKLLEEQFRQCMAIAE